VTPVLRSHRALAYMVAAAAFVVAGLALVGLAWMLGWIAPRAAVYSPTAVAPGIAPVAPVSPVAPAARAPVNADGLEPGETVVSTEASRVDPMMPRYSPPVVPTPAPTTSDAVTPPAPVPAPVRKSPAPVTAAVAPAKREAYVQADPAAPGPTAPSFSRHGATPVCENCGVVSAITTYPPGLWEVRVRMQDGDLQAFHYRRQPVFRIGDRVRADGSRLTHE
ncbi:MAG TPA: hypothetical protein VM122_12845, partial [Usitatibacter sp.]|nr:hypothetical protein [Usitatibacter sp.]